MTQCDEELVQASRRGDHEAFRGLFDRYFRRILAVATGMLRNREDALDVAQETFIRAYKNLPAFKGGSSFYTWLYRIAINLSVDVQRRDARFARVVIDDDTESAVRESQVSAWADERTGGDPFDRVRNRELGARVLAALDELTPEHRAVILLREIEGLSYDEIGQVLQCAKGTVMSRLHYARKRLQARLSGYL